MSNSSSALLNTNLPLPLFIRGKVRDTYELGDCLLLIGFPAGSEDMGLNVLPPDFTGSSSITVFFPLDFCFSQIYPSFPPSITNFTQSAPNEFKPDPATVLSVSLKSTPRPYFWVPAS